MWKEYKSQFAHNITTIWTTPLTEMMINTGVSEAVSQKPYPIVMKHYKWVKGVINRLLTAKALQGSQSRWSAPIIVVLKQDGGKHLVIDYCALNKITKKFIWPMPKVEDISVQLNDMEYFSTLDLWARYHHIPLDESSILKTAFTSPFRKYIKVPFGLTQAPAFSRNSWQVFQRISFHSCLPEWYNHLQQDGGGAPRQHQASFQ